MIGRVLGTLYGMWSHQRRPRAEIVAFQNRRLREVVAHAYHHVPYYRRLFDAHGVAPADIQRAEDLRAIPLTSKRDLQALPVSDIVAHGVDPRRLLTRTTSGSSGEPMAWRRTVLETRIAQAFRVRAMCHFGLRPTDRVASVVIGRPPQPQDVQLPLRVMRAMGVYRHEIVSLVAPTDDILRRIGQISPDVLGGLSGVIARLAQEIGKADRSAIHPRFVAVGGDVLTPLMRRQIGEAFGVPVFELYTSVEGGTLGWQCRETGEFHTSDDAVIVEVLKDGNPVGDGERGEVVVTNLHAFAMPLIRYRLGDLVTKGAAACRCGQPFATIRAIEGRMIDYFPLPSGRSIHPYTIVPTLLHETSSWMRAYRLLQERTDRLVLMAVPSAAPTEGQLRELRATLLRLVGEDIDVEIRLTGDLELESNGKFRVSRSMVKSAYDDVQAADPRPLQRSIG